MINSDYQYIQEEIKICPLVQSGICDIILLKAIICQYSDQFNCIFRNQCLPRTLPSGKKLIQLAQKIDSNINWSLSKAIQDNLGLLQQMLYEANLHLLIRRTLEKTLRPTCSRRANCFANSVCAGENIPGGCPIKH